MMEIRLLGVFSVEGAYVLHDQAIEKGEIESGESAIGVKGLL